MTNGTREQPSTDTTADGEPAEASVLREQLSSACDRLAESERARQEGEERERLLRNELQHRVRNILATVRSIFARTVAAGGSPENLADHFRGRLDTLARFQAASQPSFDLEMMIADELRAFEFDDRIHVEGPETAVPQEVAVVLGLALHELATNALKFGALQSGLHGSTLHVRWVRRGHALELQWQEKGVPILAAAPMHRGFGRDFIENALPYQLDAETSFGLRPGGLLCSITLKIGGKENRIRSIADENFLLDSGVYP